MSDSIILYKEVEMLNNKVEELHRKADYIISLMDIEGSEEESEEPTDGKEYKLSKE